MIISSLGFPLPPVVLTMVHQEAELLNHRQVPRHSVDAVSVQACKTTPRRLDDGAYLHCQVCV